MVTARRVKKAKFRSRQGQTIVLGALGVLVVALMAFITLNVGNSIFEKIRIQQVADSAAFSTATIEARAFNYYAYTNRANIASMVAAMSAHASMTMANSVPGLFYAARDNFYMFAMREFALCATCCIPPVCAAMCEHCVHGFRDLDAAWDLEDRAQELKDMAARADERLVMLIKLIDTHMYAIALSQAMVFGAMVYDLGKNSLQEDLRKEFAPAAQLGELLSVGNVFHFTNAHVMPPLLPLAGDGTKRVTYVAWDIANGSRASDFVHERDASDLYSWVFPLTLVPDLLYEHTEGVDGFSLPVYHEGEADTTKSGDEYTLHVHSHDEGLVMSTAFQCWLTSIPNIAGYEYDLESDTDGGSHDGHSWLGMDSEPPCEGGHDLKCLNDDIFAHNCFMLFNANPDRSLVSPYQNQPPVYSLLHQDLSIDGHSTAKRRGPWTINDQGKVTIDLGEGQVASVQISNQVNEGVAISKSLVYYHYPASWKEHPNFFNPYWKAKLQPYRCPEAIAVLAAEGYTELGIMAISVYGLPMP